MPGCLLAIETSTDACSVAVSVDNVIFERFAVMPKQHAQKILEMLDAFLAELEITFSRIDALAFGAGPGSFTGLRIAASVVQGLAVAWDRPVVPVSTLHALAQGAYRQCHVSRVLSCLDARMGEVYGGYYEFSSATQHMAPFATEFLCRPAEIIWPETGQWTGVGSGCSAYFSSLMQQERFVWQPEMGEIYPHAYDVATLAVPRFATGDVVSAEFALPVYLRESVVK